VTKNGVDILSLEDSVINWFEFSTGTEGKTELYDLTIGGTALNNRIKLSGADTKVYDLKMDTLQYIEFAHANIIVYNIDVTNGAASFSPSASPTTAPDLIRVWGGQWYTRFIGSNGVTMKNIFGRGFTSHAIRCQSITANNYLVNPDFDSWTFYWEGVNTGEVYRQYEFDLTVTYPNGTAINGTSTGTRVVIQHYGNNSGVDYNATLNGDGTINQTRLTMGFYNQTGGDTIYSYNPFNLQVTNTTGYQDINMNFTLDEKKDWTKALTAEIQPSPGTVLAVAGFAFTMFSGISNIHNEKKKGGWL